MNNDIEYSLKKREGDVSYHTTFYPKIRVCKVESCTLTNEKWGDATYKKVGSESMNIDDARDLWTKMVRDGYKS